MRPSKFHIEEGRQRVHLRPNEWHPTCERNDQKGSDLWRPNHPTPRQSVGEVDETTVVWQFEFEGYDGPTAQKKHAEENFHQHMMMMMMMMKKMRKGQEWYQH